ncbi:MAG: hypothetical protein HY680_03610 [Chloroflexi bacterium]|nr:hypothetical protein [Chloroflexota bacterium]
MSGPLTPRPALLLRLLPLLAALALLLLAVGGCGSAGAATEWTFGDSLVIRVKETRSVNEARYSMGDKHYLIRPSDEDHALLATHLEVFNRQANLVYLTIHKGSLSLRDDKSTEYRPVDPFQDATEVDAAGPGENTLVPFVWADGSAVAPTIAMPSKCGQNNENCQLVGWVLFDVPKNIKLSHLVWEAADTVYLYFAR